MPLVSVIIPTRNSASTIESCLQSIKTQTYPNIEIIVIDNHSADATQTIAAQYANKVITHGPERSAQRNRGAEEAGGEYILMIDSDMIVSPGVIAACLAEITAPRTLALTIPEESYGQGFWAACKQLERSFYNDINWIEAPRFFRTETFRRLYGYDPGMISGEDWDLSQRIGRLGRIGRITETIYHNEGRMTFWRAVSKKGYYGRKFTRYAAKHSRHPHFARQTGIISRYRLFFAQPRKLFGRPLVGLGMLWLKTCEFAIGGLQYAIGSNMAAEAPNSPQAPTSKNTRQFLSMRHTASLFDKRLQCFIDEYRAYKKNHPNPLKILDIGCGHNCELYKFIDKEDAYFGCDYQKIRASIHDYRTIDLNEQALSDIYPETTFDVIFCGEVIEHLFSPNALLDEIKRLMHRRSILILSTPNLSYYLNRLMLLFGISPFFLENSAEMKLGRKFKFLGQGNQTEGHIRVFTYGALRDLLRQKGLTILSVKAVPVWHNIFDTFICYFSTSLAPNNVFVLKKDDTLA